MPSHEAQIRAVLERHTHDLLAPAARDERVSRRVWASLRRDLRALGFGRFRTWRAVRRVRKDVRRRQEGHRSGVLEGDLLMGEVLAGAVEVLVAFFDG